MKSSLPLEELFRVRAQTRPTELPQMSADYYAQYQQILNIFRTEYYPKIDAGLAANSKVSGFFTAHDAEHFDEVVLHAGNLICANDLIARTGSNLPNELNAFELYILLVAIRVHDVGNMYGRDKHEKMCFQILRDIGSASGNDDAEKKLIASIAQAHGGLTSSGSKDTIGNLQSNIIAGSVSARPRLLAGIVRIADEICENRRRAANTLIRSTSVPKHSEIYHKYAASLIGNQWSRSDSFLTLRFEAKLSDIVRAWGCEERKSSNGKITETYLLDEIFRRLDKMNLERKYCNIFTKEIFTIDSIRASINIVTDEEHESIKTIVVPELSDIGYPQGSEKSLLEKMEEYCGPKFANELNASLM